MLSDENRHTILHMRQFLLIFANYINMSDFISCELRMIDHHIEKLHGTVHINHLTSQFLTWHVASVLG